MSPLKPHIPEITIFAFNTVMDMLNKNLKGGKISIMDSLSQGHYI